MSHESLGGYVLITPARNESATILETIESVIRQTHPPVRWVVVDDGSTDDTVGLIQRYLQRIPGLQLVRRKDRGFDAVGGGVVEVFNVGAAALGAIQVNYIGKLDADIALAPDYFESLVRRMDSKPLLGIASGQNYLLSPDGGMVMERHLPFHPVGGARLYRREVFDAIGPLVQSPGWDTLDVVRARMRGFGTRNYDDLKVLHLRTMGTRKGLREGVLREGRVSYLLGYSRLYFAARVVAFALRRPRLRCGWWILVGYLRAALARETRICNEAECRWLRRFQLGRLFGVQGE